MEANSNNNKSNSLIKELAVTAALAMAGGLLGGGIWFGLSFLGRMAVISGLIAGALGFTGAFVSGKNNLIVKCIIAGLISFGLYGLGIYLGIGVDILVVSEYSISLGDAVSLIPPLLQEGSYLGSLALQLILGVATYGLGVAGAYMKCK